MQEVISKLNKIINELSNKDISNREELEFFKTKIKTSGGIKLSTIDQYKNSDFLLANIKVIFQELEFSEIKKFITPIEYDLNNTNIDLLVCAFQFLDEMDAEKVEKLLEKKNIYSKFLRFYNRHGIDKSVVVDKDPLFNNGFKFEKLVILFQQFREAPVFSNLIELNNCLPLLEDNLINSIQMFAAKGTVVSREKTKSIKKLEKEMDTLFALKALAEEDILVEAIDSVNTVDKVLKSFSEYVTELERIEKEEKRSNNKKANLYRQLIIKIKNYKKLTSDDIDFIEDEELKKEVILSILEKNKISYNTLLDDFKLNKKTEINTLDKILIKYNIVIYDEISKSLLVKNLDLDIIEKMLMQLNENEFDFIMKDEKLLVRISMFSSVSNINIIKYWLSEEIITEDFLKENVDILISEKTDLNQELLEIYERSNINPLFNKVNENIELFGKNNICLQNIKKYDINLFLKEKIITSFELLNKYNLDLSSEDLIDYSIIENPKKINIVDLFIEIGMFDYLKNHIELINKDSNIIKRILLLKEINYPIFDENNILLNIITDDNKFYIPDKEIDTYLNNDSLNHINIECYLALEENKNNKIDDTICCEILMSIIERNCKIDDNQYNFNGIIISRNKVLRNMTSLKNIDFKEQITEKEKIISSILFNSILDEESINIILNSIDDMLIIANKQLKK